MQIADNNIFTEVVEGILLFDCSKMAEFKRIEWRQKQDAREHLYTEHGCKLWGEGRTVFAIVYDLRKVQVKRFMDALEAARASLNEGWDRLGISPDGGEMYWKRV